MKTPRPLPPDVLAAKRRSAEGEGWTVKPGAGGGVMIGERGSSTKYASSLQALLEHIEASARPKLSVPGTPGTPDTPRRGEGMGRGIRTQIRRRTTHDGGL